MNEEKVNWHYYIALESEEQFEILIDELTFLKNKMKEIKGDRSDHCCIELKSKDWCSDEAADIFEATIKY